MPQTSFTSRFASSSRYLDSTSAVTLPDNRAVEKSPWNDSTPRPWADRSSQSTGSIAPSTLPARHARVSILYLAWLPVYRKYPATVLLSCKPTYTCSHTHARCPAHEYRYAGMTSHISGQLSLETHLSRRHHPLYGQALQRVRWGSEERPILGPILPRTRHPRPPLAPILPSGQHLRGQHYRGSSRGQHRGPSF